MSIGETLRQARLESGITLDEISGRTRINLSLLHAIEADELHRLPTGAIGRSFVKQYAQVVGIDSTSLVKDLANAAPPASVHRASESFRPKVPSMNARPRGYGSLAGSLLWVLAVIVFCSGAYWLFMRPHAASPPRPVTAQQK